MSGWAWEFESEESRFPGSVVSVAAGPSSWTVGEEGLLRIERGAMNGEMAAVPVFRLFYEDGSERLLRFAGQMICKIAPECEVAKFAELDGGTP